MKKVLILLGLVVLVNIAGCAKTNVDSEVKSEETVVVEDSKEESSEDSNEALSDDLYDFEVKVNGKKYSIPFDYSEMKSDNWQIQDKDADIRLSSNQYTIGNTLKNGDNKIVVRFANFTPNEIGLEESKVSSITLDDYNLKSGTKIELPKGINFESSMEDVIDAFGEPSNKSESGKLAYLKYEVGIYEKIEIVFNTETKAMNKIQIENLNDKPKTNSNSEQTNAEVPKRDLGTDVLSKNFEFDGVVYTLPASIAELASSGWKVQNEAGQKVAAGSSNVRVTLRKGNVSVKVTVKNNTPNETEVENCVLTAIEVKSQDNISIKLPNEIQVGSTKAEVEAAFDANDMKISNSTNFDYYNYMKNKYHIDMVISQETGLITSIRVYEY